MTTLHPAPAQPATPCDVCGDPGRQAFLLLRTVFTVAPIVFGLDKFADLLTDWHGLPGARRWTTWCRAARTRRCSPSVSSRSLAGVLVAVRPRLGGYVVAAWLAGIIGNLLLIPDFYDVALRDFGLLVAALALARLAAVDPATVRAGRGTSRRHDRTWRAAAPPQQPAAAPPLRVVHEPPARSTWPPPSRRPRPSSTALGLPLDTARAAGHAGPDGARRTPRCSRRDRST